MTVRRGCVNGLASPDSASNSEDFFFSSNDDEAGCSGDERRAIVCNSHTRSVKNPPTVLHWVRTSSLRVHDNPALHTALTMGKLRFRAVYIIDPWFTSGSSGKYSANRMRFLLESLRDMDNTLRTSYNSRLHVVMGQPVAVIERLTRQWNVSHITFQLDKEPGSNILEDAVVKLAASLEIQVQKFCTQTLYGVERLAKLGSIRTFQAFKYGFPGLGFPEQPLPPPPKVTEDSADEEEEQFGCRYNIPTMADMGFPSEELYTSDWIGGETEALRRLPIYCQLRSLSAQNLVDMLFDKSSLSPYVRFGCLSVRKFVWHVREFKTSNPRGDELYKDVFTKLLQREFYFMVSSQVPNFDSAARNPVCMALPWDWDDSLFGLWKDGRTGFPWIDAAIRQLRKEGWIHHYLRESLACFLTRGDLWISWEHGKDVFEQLLLDYEPSVSCGCWIRSSCSGFLTGPVEHYCPVTFGQKIDPLGQFVRAFVPELKNMPSEYIYCPWQAPPEVQKASGCILGTDYPLPMVDYITAGTVCCDKLKGVMKGMQKAQGVASCTVYSDKK